LVTVFYQHFQDGIIPEKYDELIRELPYLKQIPAMHERPTQQSNPLSYRLPPLVTTTKLRRPSNPSLDSFCCRTRGNRQANSSACYEPPRLVMRSTKEDLSKEEVSPMRLSIVTQSMIFCLAFRTFSWGRSRAEKLRNSC